MSPKSPRHPKEMTNEVTCSVSPIRTARGTVLSVKSLANLLEVNWINGHKSKFHYIWLRDNCPCRKCRDPLSRQRLFDTADIPISIVPSGVRLDDVGQLELRWSSDDHRSVFEVNWLRSHCYSNSERIKRKHRPVLWNGDFDPASVEMTYEEIVSGDGGVLRWLEMIRDYGFAIVSRVSAESKNIEQLANLVGNIQETNFGRWFDIVSKPEPKHLAYSAVELKPHTDDAYSYWPPGVEFFHCLATARAGGQTILVDGLNVAAHFRQTHMEEFRLLSKVGCHFEYQSEDTDLRAEGRIICLDEFGAVTGIRWNERLAGPFNLPERLMEPYYKAYQTFQLMLRSEEFAIKRRLDVGELLVFDNHRVLHGRTAFDSKGVPRHIRGCLLTRDSFHSRLRSLHQQVRNEAYWTVLPVGSPP
jgi:gamma-butyrobetaine dioxygenase